MRYLHRDIRTAVIALACSAMGTILFSSLQSFADADGDPATDNLSRVIPYEGTIELDGVGFVG
ncbi:MAG: hypothetical protein KC561_00835, partial [Myxococcales bacterium]|nr:hypothetical protein [Myxococcales bacterium]